MGDFVVNDSGKRQNFDTGAKRDTQEGKPRYDINSPIGARRVAEVAGKGAVKYSEENEINWTKGIPSSRLMASAMRHLEAYRYYLATGVSTGEDDLAATVWNLDKLMHNEGGPHDDLTKLWNTPGMDDDEPRIETHKVECAWFKKEGLYTCNCKGKS